MNHSHVLVVGGTCMLADASVWLEQYAEKVSVIGRKQHKYKKLQERMKIMVTKKTQDSTFK
ncbi:hypothetical protein [Bacillus sp. V2I10]|uniref:hypothetical protein n=1 Tax=Bacillus sp. V2I10 TaxID=3042276 RepID=UPI00277E4C92|nr:hypothetical protein [Bacillus sp. V2I10]MDQ0861347.1 thioredoxin reductase [Bacillus sp. V2I10]